MIGEAEARRDATIAEAKAEEQRMEAKLENDINIARSKRNFKLKILTYYTKGLFTAATPSWFSFNEIFLSRGKSQGRG